VGRFFVNYVSFEGVRVTSLSQSLTQSILFRDGSINIYCKLKSWEEILESQYGIYPHYYVSF